MADIKTYWIRGLLIFVVIWLVNYVVTSVSFLSGWISPIDITKVTLDSFTNVHFLISILLYPLIIGWALTMIEQQVR